MKKTLIKFVKTMTQISCAVTAQLISAFVVVFFFFLFDGQYMIPLCLRDFKFLAFFILCQTWPKGYKTFFMLSLAETKIYHAYKC